jgi:hypothetical protein
MWVSCLKSFFALRLIVNAAEQHINSRVGQLGSSNAEVYRVSSPAARTLEPHLVAQALLPVRFCEFKVLDPITIAKTAQARVPVLLASPAL